MSRSVRGKAVIRITVNPRMMAWGRPPSGRVSAQKNPSLGGTRAILRLPTGTEPVTTEITA